MLRRTSTSGAGLAQICIYKSSLGPILHRNDGLLGVRPKTISRGPLLGRGGWAVSKCCRGTLLQG
jgi:hypothetical protein